LVDELAVVEDALPADPLCVLSDAADDPHAARPTAMQATSTIDTSFFFIKFSSYFLYVHPPFPAGQNPFH
jgi:hypothetical protein